MKDHFNKMNVVKKYLQYHFKNNPSAFNGDRSEIEMDILDRLKRATKITNLTFNDLLEKLDFSPNDKSLEKLESFLSELRAIFWINNFSFKQITPLKARKKRPNPDFQAYYQGKKVIIEVACITKTHEQQKDKKYKVYINWNEKFRQIIIDKANNKIRQLDSFNSKIKVLLFVINSEPIKSLNNKRDLADIIENVYQQLKWKHPYYLGVCTGMVDLDTGEINDFIYPEL